MANRKIIALTSSVFFGLSVLGIGATPNNHKELKCELIQEEQPSFHNADEKARYDKLVEEGKEIEKEKIRQEKENRKREELEKQKAEKERTEKEKTFILTFYTSLDCENGYGAITCRGQKLQDGIVANNVLPLGTKIQLENIGEVVVSDRGGADFNSSNRLDVFVPRRHGESESHYYNRVNNMGRVKVKGTIIE